MDLQERQHRHVLVVDDDPDWRALLRTSLEELGYHVEEATNGEEALQSLRVSPCAVMLLDLRMPGLSGEDVLARLPRDGPRVVLLTAAEGEEVQSALRRGPHYFFPKGAGAEGLSLLLESLDP